MSYARFAFMRATDGLYDSTFVIAIVALIAFTLAALAASIAIYNTRRHGAAGELAEDGLKLEDTNVRVGEQPLSPIVR